MVIQVHQGTTEASTDIQVHQGSSGASNTIMVKVINHGNIEFKANWWPEQVWPWSEVKSFRHKSNLPPGVKLTDFLKECIALALQGIFCH